MPWTEVRLELPKRLLERLEAEAVKLGVSVGVVLAALLSRPGGGVPFV